MKRDLWLYKPLDDRRDILMNHPLSPTPFADVNLRVCGFHRTGWIPCAACDGDLLPDAGAGHLIGIVGHSGQAIAAVRDRPVSNLVLGPGCDRIGGDPTIEQADGHCLLRVVRTDRGGCSRGYRVCGEGVKRGCSM